MPISAEETAWILLGNVQNLSISGKYDPRLSIPGAEIWAMLPTIRSVITLFSHASQLPASLVPVLNLFLSICFVLTPL